MYGSSASSWRQSRTRTTCGLSIVRGHARLAQEPRTRARYGRPRTGHQLDRDVGAEDEVLGEPHAAHAAVRDLANEAERAGENLTRFDLHEASM